MKILKLAITMSFVTTFALQAQTTQNQPKPQTMLPTEMEINERLQKIHNSDIEAYKKKYEMEEEKKQKKHLEEEKKQQEKRILIPEEIRKSQKQILQIEKSFDGLISQLVDNKKADLIQNQNNLQLSDQQIEDEVQEFTRLILNQLSTNLLKINRDLAKRIIDSQQEPSMSITFAK